MFPLLETIKVINGIPQNLLWHQKRYDHSIKSLYGRPSKLNLEETIQIPGQFKKGKVKARLLYDDKQFSIKFDRYTPRIVRSLKIIENNEIDYGFKFTDRSLFLGMFEEKVDCDDILIVKQGKVTDSSIANIVFFDGKKWFTPKFPLLKGTAREKLLYHKRIFLRDITLTNLKNFSHFRIINSMLDFDEQEMLDISSIY